MEARDTPGTYVLNWGLVIINKVLDVVIAALGLENPEDVASPPPPAAADAAAAGGAAPEYSGEQFAPEGEAAAAAAAWRLETAQLPRVDGLNKAEALAMLMLPAAAGESVVLLLYEGGVLGSYNLTEALTPSAEYAAGTLLLARPSWSLSVGLALLGAAAVLLLAVLGYLGVRIGIHATLASWATYPRARLFRLTD